MNGILKYGMRTALSKFSKPSGLLLKSIVSESRQTMAFSRTLWHMCSTSDISSKFLKPKTICEFCQCGCSGMLHTTGEKDLVEFLHSEIAEEKKALKMKSLPAELDGFVISTNQAELTFKKKNQLETIIISMNVNHSVDSDDSGEEGDYQEEMKAKPSFEVEIVRNKKTLCFLCSFIQYNETSDADAEDIFEINEVSFFEGDWEEKTYAIAADLLDENLYDLFMVVLNEKGITKKFIERVSEIATSHEHSQYICLLENVQKFASVN